MSGSNNANKRHQTPEQSDSRECLMHLAGGGLRESQPPVLQRPTPSGVGETSWRGETLRLLARQDIRLMLAAADSVEIG